MPPPASIPFNEVFNVASPTLGGSWETISGQFNVTSGGAAPQAAGSAALLEGVTATDVTLTANVNTTGVSCARLQARIVGDSNYYLGSLCSGGFGYNSAIISKVVQGVSTTLWDKETTLSAGTLAFTVSEGVLALSLNGVVLASAFDDSLGSGGVGIQGSPGATFADFVVSVPPTTVPLPYNQRFADGAPTGNAPTLGANWQLLSGDFNVTGGAATSLFGGSLAVLDTDELASDVVVTSNVATTGTACARPNARELAIPPTITWAVCAQRKRRVLRGHLEIGRRRLDEHSRRCPP